MKRQIRGQRVLITGASSGIGAELAREFARSGARLVLVARRRAQLEALAVEIDAAGGPRPIVIVADLSTPGEAAKVAARATAGLGGVDILVNNAGAAVGGLQWHVGDGAAARSMLEVSYWTPLALIEALVPEMIQRKNGVVVNVTSMAQVQTWPALGSYTASKAALALATETLRLELRGTGVDVLEAIPGPTETATQAEIHLVPGMGAAMRGVPVGDARLLARRIVRSIGGRRQRLVFVRLLWISYLFPGITRAYIRFLANRTRDTFDVNDARVIRSGSDGDPESQEARRQWEADRSARSEKRPRFGCPLHRIPGGVTGVARARAAFEI